MEKKKFIAEAFLPILALLFINACLKSADSPEAPTRGDVAISLRVSGSPTQFQSLARSASVTISGADMADLVQVLTLTDTSVEGSVLDVPAGKDRKIEISVYDAQKQVVYDGSTVADVKANAANRISITVKRLAGTVNVDGTISENPDGTLLIQKSLRAGAQSSAQYGSFLDIDEFRTYLIAEAKTKAPEIDLVFAYSTSTISAAIYAPYAAQNGISPGPGFDFMSSFGPANATELKEGYRDFAGITTRRQLDSLWSIGAPSSGRLLLSNGTVFMARSNRGLPVLIQAVAVDQSASGNADFVGKSYF